MKATDFLWCSEASILCHRCQTWTSSIYAVLHRSGHLLYIPFFPFETGTFSLLLNTGSKSPGLLYTTCVMKRVAQWAYFIDSQIKAVVDKALKTKRLLWVSVESRILYLQMMVCLHLPMDSFSMRTQSRVVEGCDSKVMYLGDKLARSRAMTVNIDWQFNMIKNHIEDNSQAQLWGMT